jgi:hypothetical protein
MVTQSTDCEFCKSLGSISDDETFYRLHGAGLAKREGGRIGPANMLYARFFKGVQ